MSKELEALEKIKQATYFADFELDATVGEDYKKEINIIETALKRLENYEQNEDFNKDVLNYAFLNEKDKIKKLKALEIIKEKAMTYPFIRLKNDRGYRMYDAEDYGYIEITKEEYELLVEVLGNIKEEDYEN